MESTSNPVDKVFQDHEAALKISDLEAATQHFSPYDKIALLFDGPNFFGTVKALRFTVEYSNLFRFFRELSRVQAIHYFTAVSDDPHHKPLMTLLGWMVDHGVRVKTRNSIKDMTIEEGSQWKGNMDVEIAVDTLVECENVDHIVLFTGDGDFVPLVKACQRRGQKVTVVSSRMCVPSYLSKDLKDAADGFIDIGLLDGVVGTIIPPRPVETKEPETVS